MNQVLGKFDQALRGEFGNLIADPDIKVVLPNEQVFRGYLKLLFGVQYADDFITDENVKNEKRRIIIVKIDFLFKLVRRLKHVIPDVVFSNG